MDYACDSGAECRSIQPAGACSQLDTVLAHASYAFNSYWQRTRATGGTATTVTSDPISQQNDQRHCHLPSELEMVLEALARMKELEEVVLYHMPKMVGSIKEDFQ